MPQPVDIDALTALICFPRDSEARRAFELYTRFDRTAATGQSIELSADDYYFLTSNDGLSRPALTGRAATARNRGLAAAWPFVRMFLAGTDADATLAAAYREMAELKQKTYAETKQRLTERFPELDSDRVDRKYFEEVRREFASVLHFWMAFIIITVATERGPDLQDPQKLAAFLWGAERCAEYLGTIAHQNRHSPPVDVTKLERIPPFPDNG